MKCKFTIPQASSITAIQTIKLHSVTVLWPSQPHCTTRLTQEMSSSPFCNYTNLVNLSECPERTALLKCGFLLEMISSWGSALKTARNHFLKAVNLSKNLQRKAASRQNIPHVLTVISTHFSIPQQAQVGGLLPTVKRHQSRSLSNVLLWTHHTHTHTNHLI